MGTMDPTFNPVITDDSAAFSQKAVQAMEKERSQMQLDDSYQLLAQMTDYKDSPSCKEKQQCNYSESKVDMAEQLNRKLKGWAMFYQFVDFKAKVFSYIDRVVFWKLAHWLARKYRTGIASLMRWWCKSPKPGQSKTWVLFGKTNHGKLSGEILYWLVGQGKKLFRWRLPEGNPYLRTETRNTYTSRFTEVAMAFASI